MKSPKSTSPGASPKARRSSTGPASPAGEEADRIAKVIARAGLCSRREAETWVTEGRVALNGRILTSPAVTVKPGDAILVDGKPLPERDRTRLWLFHKPRGLVTTNRDPEGRQTVFDALPEDMPRVMTVGRLDINTEGLLLLTNDGGLARVLELPATGWLRRYRVRAHGEIDQAKLDGLRDGVAIDGILYGAIEATLDRRQGDNVWITMGLREGKNREVKTILAHLGLDVNRLIRLSFGPFQLGDLAVGAVDEVPRRVLRDQLGERLTGEAGADFTLRAGEREPVQHALKAARAGERPAGIAEQRERPAPRARQDRDGPEGRSRTAPAKVETREDGGRGQRRMRPAEPVRKPRYDVPDDAPADRHVQSRREAERSEAARRTAARKKMEPAARRKASDEPADRLQKGPAAGKPRRPGTSAAGGASSGLNRLRDMVGGPLPSGKGRRMAYDDDDDEVPNAPTRVTTRTKVGADRSGPGKPRAAGRPATAEGGPGRGDGRPVRSDARPKRAAAARKEPGPETSGSGRTGGRAKSASAGGRTASTPDRGPGASTKRGDRPASGGKPAAPRGGGGGEKPKGGSGGAGGGRGADRRR